MSKGLWKNSFKNTGIHRCRKCKTIKPLEMFNRDKTTHAGRKYICKQCANNAKGERERFLIFLAKKHSKRLGGIKLRFHILQRDNFTCQYCGRKAPEVILEIDHKIPISKNGKDEENNLITACFKCNRGKRDS